MGNRVVSMQDRTFVSDVIGATETVQFTDFPDDVRLEVRASVPVKLDGETDLAAHVLYDHPPTSTLTFETVGGRAGTIEVRLLPKPVPSTSSGRSEPIEGDEQVGTTTPDSAETDGTL